MKVYGQLLFYVSIIQKGLSHIKIKSLPKNIKGTEIGEKHDSKELEPLIKLLIENFDLIEKDTRDVWILINYYGLIRGQEMKKINM